MRYLVTARLKPGMEDALAEAIRTGRLGRGSVAGGEYLRVMKQARRLEDGRVQWVEVCYCPTPLQEEIPYWEEFFDIERVRDAHNRENCLDENGAEAWACGRCDCTEKLERRMTGWGEEFLLALGV